MIEYDRSAKAITACVTCTPVLAGGAGGQSTLKYRVRVQQPKYRSEETGFTVAVCVFDEDAKDDIDWSSTPFASADDQYGKSIEHSFSVVGSLGRVTSGDTIDVLGIWENTRYGWQLKAGAAVPVVGHNEQALRAYLARFPQVGPRRAKDIIQKIGGRDKVLAALESGDHSALCRVDGITMDRAKAICAAYQDDNELRDCMLWLSEMGLSSQMIADVLDEWGAKATPILKDNPYALMDLPRVGFIRADDIALTKFHVERHDPRRSAAAVLFILETVEDEGHTWVDYDELTFEPERHGTLTF